MLTIIGDQGGVDAWVEAEGSGRFREVEGKTTFESARSVNRRVGASVEQ